MLGVTPSTSGPFLQRDSDGFGSAVELQSNDQDGVLPWYIDHCLIQGSAQWVDADEKDVTCVYTTRSTKNGELVRERVA